MSLTRKLRQRLTSYAHDHGVTVSELALHAVANHGGDGQLTQAIEAYLSAKRRKRVAASKIAAQTP